MKTLGRKLMSPWFCGLVAWCVACTQTAARNEAPAPARSRAPSHLRDLLGDYDAELRRPDGHVDGEAMVAKLQELGVTTYFWLLWHAPTDWEDLKSFLPLAAQARIQVWVYLVPPSESPPHTSAYSEPFRLDYQRWAEEIASLSLQHPNLAAWVIDDFCYNRQVFTPDYVRAMQARTKRINPRLAFLPLMYFGEIERRFLDGYREVIDGVVVAYPQDREEINQAWAILSDLVVIPLGELTHPWATASQAGDYVSVSQTATVRSADRYRLWFRERDDYTGPTAGYHFKQFLVDDLLVWEEDVAGGERAARDVSVDLTSLVRGKTKVTLAFRLLDRKGVGNFGVRWRLSDLQAEGLRLPADLRKPQKWQVSRHGAFEAGFGKAIPKGKGQFHVPMVVMTAGLEGEFRMRHGDPGTPERIADWVRMSLQAWHDGKCEGVVTYCLDKQPRSETCELVRDLFRSFQKNKR